MGGGTSTTALFVFGDGVLFEQKEQEIKDDYVTGRWWWIGASSRGPSAEIYELTKKWRREGFFMYASKNRWRIDEFVVGSFFFFFFFLVAGNKRAISQRWRNLHQFPNSIGVVTPSPDWVKSFLANPHGNPNDHPPPPPPPPPPPSGLSFGVVTHQLGNPVRCQKRRLLAVVVVVVSCGRRK